MYTRGNPLNARKFALTAIVLSLVLASMQLPARSMNGFVIGSDALIPADEIHSGGPPRDGIPSIDQPLFEATGEVTGIAPTDPVLGLFHQGIAKAYPIAVMNWHEIVNDRFAQEPVVITYCPLCGSGVAYTAEAGGMELVLGVSGLLFNSDVLLYDRQTESLWSQMMSQAVSGPMKGERLKKQPLVHTSWSEWLAEHPDTQLLSRKTGFSRDYSRDPYAGYIDSEGVWFPVAKKDPRYHPKERVLGLELDGKFKAYPFAELSGSGGEIMDRFAGRALTLRYNPKGPSARVFDARGKEIPAITSFWFAWYAFHPETEVYRAP